jgi:hypothetical protein
MRRARITLLTLGLLALVLVPSARATYDPLGSGKTKLLLDKGFVSFLKADAIKFSAKAEAKQQGNAYSLPVTGGNLDPTIGKGEIEQAGTLVFSAGARTVPLREITVKTKHSPLIAKVGGSQLKLATSSKLSYERSGFGGTFSARKLKLSAKVATRLNKKLRPKVPFIQGQLLGSLLTKAQPSLLTITEAGSATLTFDPAFIEKLDQRFVSLNPIFPTQRSGSAFSFPIAAAGSLAPNGSEGTLRAAGAVELLQLGAGQVFWAEPWLDLAAHFQSAEADLEPTPAFPGKVGRVGIFDASPGTFSADPAKRTMSGSGIALSLTASAAAQLNQAFAQGKGDFAAGEAAGVLGFGAVGQ